MIEIIVSSKPNVNQDWLAIAKTKRALDQIKKGL
jgi:(p)ppGpp synthase/HD superfamily hydrolase